MGFGLPFFPPRPVPGTHIHRYDVVTSRDLDHVHVVAGTTSPVINPGPRHVHLISGTTTIDQGHAHRYTTLTGPPVPAGRGTHIHRFTGIVQIAGRIPHIHRFSGVTAPARDDVRPVG